MEPASGQVDPGEEPAGDPAVEGVEVPRLRTESSRTYQLEDGRFTTVVSAGPVNFRGPDGRWQQIDNTLVASARGGFAWENRANAYRVLLPDRPGREAVRFEHDGAWVSFSLRGAVSVEATVRKEAATVVLDDGVSIRWVAGNTALKEEIVLAGPQAPSSFLFDLRLSPGLRPEVRADGGIDFVKPGGVFAFSFAAPFMVDGSGIEEGFSTSVAYDLAKNAEGYELRVVADREWLSGPSRVWPVTIDPTVSLAVQTPKDCHIASGANANDDQCESSYLRVGYTANNAMKRRMLLQFGMGGELVGRTVTTASLALWCEGGSSGTNAYIDLRRVTRSWTTNATWNKHNGSGNWTTPGGDFGPSDWATRNTDCSSVGWKLWTAAGSNTLAGLVNHWLNGTYPNDGLLLKQEGETTDNLLTFISHDHANSTRWPELRVTFNNTPPEEPEDLLPDDGTVDWDGTPTLSGTYLDADPGDTGRLKFRVLTCPDEFCDTYTVVASGEGNMVAPGQTSSWTPPPLTGGQTYYWQAQTYDGLVYNESDQGLWSEPQGYHVLTGPAATDLEPAGSVFYETEPTLSAIYVHPDGFPGRVQFSIETLEGTAVSAGNGTWVASGQRSSWTVPPGVLSESDEYVWSAVATDGVTSSSQASLASYETEPGPDQAEVVFVEAMQVEDAILWAEGHGVRPVDLNASYAMSDETIQLSYRVPDLENALSSSAAAIASDYSQITLEGTESLVEELTADDETSQDQILLAGWVAGSLAGGDIPVESILVAGTTGALADLAFDASVSSVVIRSQGASEESETEAEDDPVMCDGSDETPEHAPRPWGAYSGRITTTRLYDANGSPTGRRSIYQSMKWNNTRIKRMKCHIPIIIFGQQTGTAQYAHTYEADAKFTLRNGTYLGGKRVYYSNMPKKRYLDNRWLEDDRSWTVGTTNMKKMKANKLYWTYIVTKAGTAPKDRGHIYGDIGRKSFCPPGGAWAFCISSWDTYYIIFPNKYRAPSTVKWSQ